MLLFTNENHISLPQATTEVILCIYIPEMFCLIFCWVLKLCLIKRYSTVTLIQIIHFFSYCIMYKFLLKMLVIMKVFRNGNMT